MHKSHALVLALLLPLASSALLSACKTDTYESGAVTGKTVQQAADEVDRSIVTLDATVAALNDLVEKPAPDPAPQFKVFSKNLEALEARSRNVSELAAEMESNSKVYIAQWDQQIATIANEDIRERSLERREKVDKALAEIRENYAKAREEFKPLLADLQDIRTALAADLTKDGMSTVEKTAGKVSKRAEDVKETLSDLSEKFRELGVGLGKAATPPPPTKQQ